MFLYTKIIKLLLGRVSMLQIYESIKVLFMHEQVFFGNFLAN